MWTTCMNERNNWDEGLVLYKTMNMWMKKWQGFHTTIYAHILNVHMVHVCIIYEQNDTIIMGTCRFYDDTLKN